MTCIRIGRAASAAGLFLVIFAAPTLSGTQDAVPIRSLRSSDSGGQAFTVEGIVIDDRQRGASNATERVYLQDPSGGIRVIAHNSGVLMSYGTGDRLRVHGVIGSD